MFFWNRERLKEARKDVALEDRVADLEGAISNLSLLVSKMLFCLDLSEFWAAASEQEKEALISFMEVSGMTFSVCHLEDQPEELDRVLQLPGEED